MVCFFKAAGKRESKAHKHMHRLKRIRRKKINICKWKGNNFRCSFSTKTWDTAIFRVWKIVVRAEECQSLMSRWRSYCQFTQATIRSLILTALMCVFECISFSLISGLYFLLTHSFLSGAMHCLSWLILPQQQAFISAFPNLTSQTSS